MHARHTLIASVLLFAACGMARSTHASSTIVPDNFATIQAAVASGADTVYVRPGTYLETVSLTNGKVLVALATTPQPQPQVLGLTATIGIGSPPLVLRGLRFRRQVAIHSQQPVFMESCRMDSTLIFDAYNGSLKGSIIHGNADLTPGYLVDISLNTFVSGEVHVINAGIGTNYFRDNDILGPATTGLTGSEDLVVENNYVRDCVTGIFLYCRYGSATGNLVEDCSGDGIVVDGVGGCGPELAGNTVRRCGRGIWMHSIGAVRGNWLEDLVGDGIFAELVQDHIDDNVVYRAGGIGIHASETVFRARRNRVIGAGGDGIRLQAVQTVSGNVVGRSGGGGIVAQCGFDPSNVDSNTTFLNGAPGLALSNTSGATSITYNIAHANQRGILWSAGSAPALACNDWFNNFGGNTIGVAPGPKDVSLAPGFCDLPSDNVFLSASSPIANLLGCGRLGALGVGCAIPSGVIPGAGSALELEAWPVPATSGVHLRCPAFPVAAELTIHDIAGGVRWHQHLAPGTRNVLWGRTDLRGERVPPGIYFARVRAGVLESSARIVLIR